MARAALSLMPEPGFLAATLPLFQAGEVDALEWSVDMGWGWAPPTWLTGLLDLYAAQGALYGHGVHLSMLSAARTARQAAWLAALSEEVSGRRYLHVSEHFGWSEAGPFVEGAPMPLPRTPPAVRIGQSRLGRLADACGVPVGLENLALSLSRRDAEALPAFLAELLEPVGGFILLDLHNLWCQAVNFGLDPIRLMERYPADRVRELHVSGGSWAQAAGRRFRRDTHDSPVPPPVMGLLDAALSRFPAVEVVVLERMGPALADPAVHGAFRDEFRAVRARCQAHETRPQPLPAARGVVPEEGEDAALATAQAGWLGQLAGDGGAVGVLGGWLATADPAARETTQVLAERWLKRGP